MESDGFRIEECTAEKKRGAAPQPHNPENSAVGNQPSRVTAILRGLDEFLLPETKFLFRRDVPVSVSHDIAERCEGLTGPDGKPLFKLVPPVNDLDSDIAELFGVYLPVHRSQGWKEDTNDVKTDGSGDEDVAESCEVQLTFRAFKVDENEWGGRRNLKIQWGGPD